MTDEEKRLAAVLASWVKDEIERGLMVHPVRSKNAGEHYEHAEGLWVHESICCGGTYGRPMEISNYQPTLDLAARNLLFQLKQRLDRELRLEAKKLVWRLPPVLDGGLEIGILPRYNGYCRFSFVPLDAGNFMPREGEDAE